MGYLIVGGSGFVGSQVVNWMRQAGIEVDSLSRSSRADIVSDLTAAPPILRKQGYRTVVHVAGKAHAVPKNDVEREVFFDINLMGTKNLLIGLEKQATLPEAFVFVSTVAVYGRTVGELLDEVSPLNADDPYGLSKRLAEDVVLEWGAKRHVQIGILRLPLVAGANAPGNLGAMVNAIRRGRYLGIGDGSARRSVVLATDVARIMPKVADVGGIYNLTDGRHPTFVEIEHAIARVLGKRPPRHLPHTIANAGARVGDLVLRLTGWRPPLTSSTLNKMTSTLTFDDSKARRELGWNPRSVIDNADEWAK